MSRRVRYARSSHTRRVFHCFGGPSIPRILGSTGSGSNQRRGMTHLVQTPPPGGHRAHPAGRGLTIKIDAEHTDGQYEVFEVDAPRGPTTRDRLAGQGLLRP